MPAFLSRGYHVRTDLPAHVAASGHPDVIVTPALGPSREVVRIMAEQLVNSGLRPGDSVILAAAGTSDQTAHADLQTTARLLSTLIGSPVDLAFVATGEPRLHEAMQRVRARRGRRRVAVASYLLADGLFQERLRACGADVVSPAAGHPSRPGAAHRGPIPNGDGGACRGGQCLIFDQLGVILAPWPVAKSHRGGFSTR